MAGPWGGNSAVRLTRGPIGVPLGRSGLVVFPRLAPSVHPQQSSPHDGPDEATSTPKQRWGGVRDAPTASARFAVSLPKCSPSAHRVYRLTGLRFRSARESSWPGVRFHRDHFTV